MPVGLIAWVRDFIRDHHVEEAFVKRKRDKKRVDIQQMELVTLGLSRYLMFIAPLPQEKWGSSNE